MELWEQCVRQLKREFTSAEFNTWILPLQAQVSEVAHQLVDNRFDTKTQLVKIQLFAPNRFVLEWVRNHYEKRLLELCALYSEAGTVPQITFAIGSLKQHADQAPKKAQPLLPQLAERRSFARLNADFTFATFVEGKSNQLARAASMQIGQHPGVAYNPLFIYGGVGLGKTHLMHAVGNIILSSNPHARVFYLHSERFVAEMIHALQQNKIDEFKKTYRSANALLIDDIQFFAGKERSQEEFFHTFNTLFDSRQQIVLTGDRFPKEVIGLEERLQSRFGWGLTVAIEPPDLETSVAILHCKAHRWGVALPEDVAFFVARRLCSNIRDLEGALRRLAANSRFTGKPISLEFAQHALRDLLAAQNKQVSVNEIQKIVAEYFKLRSSDMLSPRRSRSVAQPRQIAMTLAKELTKHSLPEIGHAFGGRDHTTVLHATRKIKSLRENDVRIDDDYKTLLKMLNS